MKYIKYTVKTVKQAEDIIAALLTDIEVEGVEIEDASLPEDIRKNGTFCTIFALFITLFLPSKLITIYV